MAAVDWCRLESDETDNIQNVFKSVLNAEDHAMSPGYSAVSPSAAAGRAGTSKGVEDIRQWTRSFIQDHRISRVN